MAKTVNIHEAKTNLSRIVDEVAAGSEVIIAKAGKPMARLVPLNAERPPRRFGLLKGRIKVPDDFNQALPDDVIDTFEGKS
jgi:prevent-host-death family protein